MKKGILVFAITLLAVLADSAFANVMPFNIAVDNSGENAIISYRLNETCSSVTVNIYGPLPDTTIRVSLAGTTTFGLNSIAWDRMGTGFGTASTFGINVVATDAIGHSTWTKISNDATTTFWFDYERGGCKVNKNQGSPYFGMIYNVNCAGYKGSSGRTTNVGIYAVYPDGSDPFSMGTVAFTGGVTWSNTSYSPWHLFIGADDKVWIADYTDNHSGIWRAESGNLSGDWTEILDTTGRVSNGFSPGLYGNEIAMWVEGTGSSTILYTIDQDLPSGFANNGVDPQLDSVWEYDVGEGPFPCDTSSITPTIWIDDSTFTASPGLLGYGVLVDSGNGGAPIGSQALAKDSLGRWWVSNYQLTGTNLPTIVVFSADRQVIEWDSRQAGTGGGTDPLFSASGGFVLDEPRNRVITAPYYVNNPSRSGFTVFPFDPLPSGNLSTVATTVSMPNCTARQIDVDAVGNVYIPDTQHTKLYIYSPPDGATSFTTQAGVTVTETAIEISPGPVTLSREQSRTFTATRGVPPYTWSLSTTGICSLDTSATIIVTAIDTGSVDLIVTDSNTPTPQQASVTITVIPTTAPLFKEVEPRKYIRFELFE